MFEETIKSSGRRSKLEITCDILNAISQGTEKPTRMMQLANVTWDDLIMHLENLMRNQFVSREVDGKKVTYSLTHSGSRLLDHYVSLKKEAALLNLETMTKERISKVLTYLPPVGAQETDLQSKLERRVSADGLKVISSRLVGKSGAVHTLGIVAEQSDGSKHGYVMVNDVDETQIMKLFVTQLDTELSIHAFYTGELSTKAADLARAYSLELLPWDETKGGSGSRGRGPTIPRVEVPRFIGKSLLIEVDPSISYEAIVKEFARTFSAAGSVVFVFTWKGGPIYSALSAVEDIHIFSMTSEVSYPRPTAKKNEFDVPQDDSSALLDVTSKILLDHSGVKALIILDIVSDMILSLGFEKLYAFLRAQKEIIDREPMATALFIVKRNAQDEKALSMIRALFTHHLSYDGAGLNVTRES